MPAESDLEEMLRPPINRAMKVLDRPFFKKTIPTSVARVVDRQQISKCRSQLKQDLLKLDRMQVIKTLRDDDGGEIKAFLLQPSIKPDGVFRCSHF